MASSKQPGTKGWFALQVRDRCETAVENRLVECGITALVLRDDGEVVVRRGRQWHRPPAPWIPGYVMVNCVPSPAAFVALRHQEDVIQVVGGMERPWRIRDDYLICFQDIMRERIQAERDAREAEQARKARPWIVGEKAAIVLGPFGGFDGVVTKIHKGRDKAFTLSVDVFGRSFDVKLPLASIERL